MIFALPGTKEPQLADLNSAEIECLHTFMDQISPARIEQMVRAFPGPRSRLFHPEAMQTADAMIVNGFSDAGRQVEMRPYTLLDQVGILGHGKGGPHIMNT